MFINTTLNVNETEAVLDPHDGLKDNQKYIYTIAAINNVAMITTDENIICNYMNTCYNYYTRVL